MKAPGVAGPLSLILDVSLPNLYKKLARLLATNPDGRVLHRLKHRCHDGTTYVLIEPRELVEKVAS